jgi:uncharacterized protein YqgC (DUF456 family)
MLIVGVVGSIVPMMPGALISLLGVAVYGFVLNDPSTLFIVFASLTGTVALVFDWLAGSIAASYGGASKKTSIAAGIAGFLGFFLLGGPFGLVVAVGTAVSLREYLIHSDEQDSMKAALYASIGVLGSAVVQAVLTASILLGFLLTLVI